MCIPWGGNRNPVPRLHYFFKYNFIYYLFLTVPGLYYCIGFLYLWKAGATLQLWCMGFSLWWLFLLRSTGPTTLASVVKVHGHHSCGFWAREHRLNSCGPRNVGPHCSRTYGIISDQGWNLCLLHWQKYSLHWAPREALRLYYCFSAAPPLLLHLLPSLISSFQTQGSSRRLESVP